MAKNKQVVAKANLLVSKSKFTQAAAQVDQEKPSMGQNEEQYNYATITARIDGVVLWCGVEVGDAVSEILLEEHKDVLTVPEAAIVYDKDKKASVDIYDPKAKEGRRKTSITAGISNGSKTEVLSGLKEHDQVVLQ